MNTRIHHFNCLAIAASITCWTLFYSTAQTQEILISDDFNSGTQVNPLEWRVPFPGDASFLGQTQLKTDNTQLPSISGGAAIFELDTYLDGNDGVAPDFFSGAEMITKRNFALGGGLVWKSRMKLNSTTPNGVVGGGFLFDVSRESPPGTPVRDEIDVELLSNESNGDNRVLTNTWNDENFTTGAGDSAFVPPTAPSPYDLNSYHDYEVRWTPGKVEWWIDNALVRTATGSEVPDDPMSARFNIWVPDSGFSEAYDASLVAAPNIGANQTYTMEVDSVSIERINTAYSSNLLTNGSFESVSSGSPGNWTQFNNAFDEIDNPAVPAQDGDWTLKTFGPFKGSTDASGAFQEVTTGITPGKEYSASVYAWSDSIDTIEGSDNFAQIVLTFEDSLGNVLDEKSTPIYDGRDGLLTTPGVQDAWNQFTVEGLAPAGTASAVVSLFFIQIVDPTAGPGAIWFDNASLVELIPTQEADFDDNGIVEDLDYASWDTNFGLTAGASKSLGDSDLDRDVDGIDFLKWQQQFDGSTSPAFAAATAAVIPEPSTFVLLACCCSVLLILGRRTHLIS